MSLAEPQTREREVRALAEGMQELGVSESTIVTMNDSDTIEVKTGVIHVVPAWQWLATEAATDAQGGDR